MKTEMRLQATFRPQQWANNYALDVDGQCTFDVTEKIVALSLDEIKTFRENNYDSDDLASDLPARENHDGPFEVDVDLDGWLESHGIVDRAEMTEAEWAGVRDLHQATIEA